MPEAYEVAEPILNSPFDEPAWHWHIEEGQTPEKRPGRRPAMYYYRDPKAKPSTHGGMGGTPVEMVLVNLIRQRVKTWRSDGYPGVTRTTLELLQWWHRERDDPNKRQYYDPLEEVKRAAAERWVAAVNADSKYGWWMFEMMNRVSEIPAKINAALAKFAAGL